MSNDSSKPAISVAEFRQFYAQHITAYYNVSNDHIRQAFAIVERECFVGLGPWQIPCGVDGYFSSEFDDPRLLYQDILVGLEADKGINNGQPSLHAQCLDQANPQLGDVVIHVGTGTGYYTAILAQLPGADGFVHGYELESNLASLATTNLETSANVTVYNQSALTELPSADVAGRLIRPSIGLML